MQHARTLNVSTMKYARTGSGYLRMLMGNPLHLTIEDQDMKPGMISFEVDKRSGQNVFLFELEEDIATALVPVIRIDGIDTDVSVSYRTALWPSFELAPPGDTTRSVQMPIVVQAKDSNAGGNVWCGLGESEKPGACEDSSSTTRCADGTCILIEQVDATEASRSSSFAYADGDYMSTSGELTWKQGESGMKRISIPLFRHSNSSGSLYRTFRVLLSAAVSTHEQKDVYRTDLKPKMLPSSEAYSAVSECGAAICAEEGQVVAPCGSGRTCAHALSSEAGVILTNPVGPGFIRLINTTYMLRENLRTGSVEMTVQRVGGNAGNISVAYAAIPSREENFTVLAKPGVDFRQVSGNLSWLDGDRSDRRLVVPILDDDVYVKGRLFKSFSVLLFDIEGGATLLQSQAFQVIVDDDARPGSIEFLDTTATVDESEGSVLIRAIRTKGDDTSVFVRFHTGFHPKWPASVGSPTATAHAAYLTEQSYACRTTLDGEAFAGGLPELAAAAFDSDTATFWEDIIRGDGEAFLSYRFSTCALTGAAISSYTIVTSLNGNQFGSGLSAKGDCPTDWLLEARRSDSPWNILDSQHNQTCSSDGRAYHLLSPRIGYYSEYRWKFKGNPNGATRLRIHEIFIQFDAEQTASNLLERNICDENGTCCEYASDMCSTASINSNLVRTPLRGASHDYKFTSGLLEWAEGESGVKTISVPVVDDCLGCSGAMCLQVGQGLDRSLETFPLHLSLPSNSEIREYTKSSRSIYPFRKEVQLMASRATATVHIQDDDGPGTLVLRAVSCGYKSGREIRSFVPETGPEIVGHDPLCPVLENASFVTLAVSRLSGSRGGISVRYSVEAVTAVAEVDFAPLNGTLFWNDRDTSNKTILVPVFARKGFDIALSQRAFQVRLLAESTDENGLGFASGGAALYTCRSRLSGLCVDPDTDRANVTIVDVDAATGLVQLEHEIYHVNQSDGSITVGLARVGGSDFAVEVKYWTETEDSQKGAVACQVASVVDCQYHPVSGHVRWEHNESGVKHVVIKLSSQAMRNPRAVFMFRLGGSLEDTINPCGGHDQNFVYSGIYCRSFNARALVVIHATKFSDHGYFKLRLYDWPIVVTHAYGTRAVIVIDRLGGDTGIVSVQAQSVMSGTAIQTTHFDRVQTSFAWSDGDSSSRLVSIPITPDSVPSDTMLDLTVRLAGASTNAAIDSEAASAHIFVRSTRFTPKFLEATIYESSTVQTQMNHIVLTFATNTVLGPSSIIDLEGLVNTGENAISTLSLGGEGAEIFGNSIIFDSSAGIAHFQVADQHLLLPRQSVTLTFSVRNGDQAQLPRSVFISASGEAPCRDTEVNGVGLSCPESVSITPSMMRGYILSFSTQFSPSLIQSSVCSYQQCRHSEFYGAENMIFVNVSVPKEEPTLPEGTTLSVLGLQASASVSTSLKATLVNLRSVLSPSEMPKNRSGVCSCDKPGCTCEYVLTELPLNSPMKLRAKVQCNNLGWISQGVDEIRVRVGNAVLPLKPDDFVSPSDILLPDGSCEDDCSKFHELFEAGFEVGQHVSSLGELYVSIESSGDIDHCNQGHYLWALLSVEWDPDTAVQLSKVVDATWDADKGQVEVSLPPGMQALDSFLVSFSLRNPLVEHAGSPGYILIGKTDGTFYGPAQSEGLVLIASRAGSLSVASVAESSYTQVCFL